MKPNYKNWVPKTMIWGLMAATAIMLLCFFIFGIFGSFTGGGLRIALGIIFGAAFLVCGKSVSYTHLDVYKRQVWLWGLSESGLTETA